MKLPSGKVTKTIAGGFESFQNLLNEMKGSNFTGYIAIKLAKEDAEAKGQLVVKDGVPTLADYDYKGDNSIGQEAVNNIIKDGLKAEAKLEVHSNVDVDIIIDFNTDAQVEASDFDLEAKAREIEEEEKRAREAAERQARESQRRTELVEQIKVWKSEGYIVSGLESTMDGKLTDIENKFKEYETAVTKLKELDQKFSSLNTKGFESEVDAVEMMLNNPDKVVELEKKVLALEKTISTKTKKEAELRKKIEAWKSEGYNVSNLESVLDTDFAQAWDAFTAFMDDLQKLKEYEERLKKLNTVGFEPMVKQIQINLKNPDALGDLEAQFGDLEMRINEANERKAEFKKQVDAWTGQGISTKRFRNLLKEPLEKVEQMIIEFENDLATLKELRDQYNNIEKAEFAAEAAELEPMFNDPDNVPVVLEKVEALMARFQELEEQKAGFREKAEEWNRLGYNVETITNIINTGKMADIQRGVSDYEGKLEKLNSYITILDGLNLVGFEKTAEKIRAKLMNPDLLPEIDKDIKDLNKKIEASEKKRSELKKRVEGWKAEGFVVSSLEPLLDGDLKVAWEEFTTIMDQIQTLKNLKEKLAGMDITGYEADAEGLKGQLNDPANAGEIEASITALEERVKAEKARRAEIRKAVSEWEKAGFVVEPIKKKLAGKLAELDQSFSDYQSRIEQMKDYQGKVTELKTRTYTAELKALTEKLTNPDMLNDVESEFTDISMKIEDETSKRDTLRSQMEAWKTEGFTVTMLEAKISGNINDAQNASTDLSDAINKLLEYRHKLGEMDLREFEADADTAKKLTNDPGNLTQLETIMKQLIKKVEEQTNAKNELVQKLDEWRSQGLVVDELDQIIDEKFSVVTGSFKKFEADIDKLMELQKKLGGAASPGLAGKDKGKAGAKAKGAAAKGAKRKAEAGAAAARGSVGDDETKRLFSEFKLNKDFVFDTFVVGTSNRFTHAAALAVAESPADAYNPLFIYGGVGLGKTHLLNSIGNHIMNNNKDASVVYVSSERFTNELINAIRYDNIDEFRDIYRTADVLIIDDIQFLAGKESTQEEFFHTFNTLYNAQKQIVVSSDRPPKEIQNLEERLRSRFEGGLITDIQPPSLETKVIILRREAKKQSIDPPDEVVHFIASKVKTNIRELRGYLTKIAAYSSLTKREITMDMAEEVLKDLSETTGAKAAPGGLAPAPEAAGAVPGVAAADSEMAGVGGTKPQLSAIEERLSSLKARLSPILTDKKNGGPPGKGQMAPQPVQAPTPVGEDGSDVFVPPESLEAQGMAHDMDETPIAEPVVPDMSSGESEIALEGDLAKCGNCGAIVSANVPECPECGVSFGGEWFECPECRAAVSADSMRCDNCGAEFEAVNGEGGAPPEMAYPQNAAAAPPPVPMQAQGPPVVDDKKRKKKKKKKK